MGGGGHVRLEVRSSGGVTLAVTEPCGLTHAHAYKKNSNKYKAFCPDLLCL